MGKKDKKKVFRKKKTIFQKGLSFIKTFDIYGKNIVLTYNGDDKYRTHIGGVTSLIVGAIILAYVGYLFHIMFNKNDTSFSTTSLLNDVITDNEILTPAEEGFDFAFTFKSNGIDYLADSTYFTFTMKQVKQQWVNTTGSSTTKRTKDDVPFSICRDNFSYDDQSEVQRLGIDNYYWPTIDDYSVAGTFYSPNFHYIEIKLNKCQGTGCKTDAEIEAAMKVTRFSMAIVNTVIDLKNYENSIQNTIDDGLFWDLVPSLRKRTDIFIRKNEAEFEDKYFQLGFPQEHEFFQVVERTDSFEAESDDGDILSLYFRYDKTSDIYERQIFSFAELLGQAGGFYGALFAGGSLLIFIFSERLFVSSVLKKIYQIDTWQEREMLTKKKEKFDDNDKL